MECYSSRSLPVILQPKAKVVTYYAIFLDELKASCILNCISQPYQRLPTNESGFQHASRMLS